MLTKEEKIDALAKLAHLLYNVQETLGQVDILAKNLGYLDIYKEAKSDNKKYESYEWAVQEDYDHECSFD